jgi:hypothetical protein
MKRLYPDGSPHHLVECFKKRQACFAWDKDMAACLQWLKPGAENAAPRASQRGPESERKPVDP